MVHSSLASSVKVGKHEGDGSQGEQPSWESRDNSGGNEYAKMDFISFHVRKLHEMHFCWDVDV
jgi:hypothetical protein